MDRVYRLPLRKITKSEAVRHRLVQRTGLGNIEVVYDPVDTGQFFPEGKVFRPAETVGMVCYESPIKGTADGFQAFLLARAEFPHLRLLAFGTKRPADLPEGAVFHRAPAQEEIRKIYSAMDVFLYPSRGDVCPNPPLEAMACQCAVVSTRVGAVPEYASDGQTALLCDIGDIRGMAERIQQLTRNPDLARRLSLAGYRCVTGNFTVAGSVQKLEKILQAS
jgi:glycosyltransferase involved in cell wall biosynthesis